MNETELQATHIFLRSPFYPIDSFWQESLSKDAFVRSEFLEALFIASPDLYHKFTEELACGDVNVKTIRAISKYYFRMCYRCTPFGMFSGMSVGTIADYTKTVLTAKENYKKHTRLDNHFLSSFVQQILLSEEVRETVLWFSNNTIYNVEPKIRFVEYRMLKTQRSYHLSDVEGSDSLRTILDTARSGAKVSELVNVIKSTSITEEDALAFIHEIIDSKLLISELDPGVTGEEPYHKLIRLLEQYSATQIHADYLKSIFEQLKTIDNQGPGADLSHYKEIVQKIHSRNREYDEKLIFQSDLIKPVESFSLSASVLDELKESISLLIKVTTRVELSNLKKFREEFQKRYEEAELPLLTALDNESGIGYPVKSNFDSDNTPLTNDMHFNGNKVASSYSPTAWDKVLWELYRRCVEKGENEIILSKEAIPILNRTENGTSIAQLPSSFASFCSILAASPHEIDEGNFEIVYRGTYGPSSVSLIGRFCHADYEISEAVRELIQKEEDQDADKIYAEVVHMAQARIGNVLIRPSLRQYEIPILTFAGVDEAHSIPLTDLMISVKNNNVVLRSKKLDKEIIPRNSTAHNFSSDSLSYYHFLCDLQFQYSKNSVVWDWGMLNELSFLPRVRYGKVILAKARWILDISKLSLSKDFTEDEFTRTLEDYSKINRIPRRVTISEADNQLPLDLSQIMSKNILMQELKRNKVIILEECMFNESNVFLSSPEGKFTNEFIIPWTKVKMSSITTDWRKKNESIPSSQRSFIPGSSWHYVKIYCGIKAADKLLIEVIRPLVDELLSVGVLQKWFFIRYSDPDHHLRIRFMGTGPFYSIITDKLNKLLRPFFENNFVWKIQNDTYLRELERYGSENIDNSESVFFYDSMASIQILSLLDGDEGDDLRWQFALKGVNDFLNSFDLDLLEKKELMSSLSAELLKEFSNDKIEGKRQLGAKYRATKDKILLAMQTDLHPDHEFSPVWKIFSERTENLRVCVSAIYELKERDKLSVNDLRLIASYIHMFLNRFLRSKQRLQEMIIYDLLCQHYSSMIARESKSASMRLKEFS